MREDLADVAAPRARWQDAAEREVGMEIWGDGAYAVYERDGVAEVQS